MDAEAFYQAELYQDAVVRNLEIIGEAAGLLIELAQPLGLAFVDLAFSLEETLGRKVDLATFDSVRRTIQKPGWQALTASIAEDLIDVETIHLLPDQF
jgi:hypothetical protein